MEQAQAETVAHQYALTAIALLNFFSVTSWTFYLFTVLGLMYLRIKEPHLARPYRTYLVTPITFCIVSHMQCRHLFWMKDCADDAQVAAFLLLMPIFAAPLEAFAALSTYFSSAFQQAEGVM